MNSLANTARHPSRTVDAPASSRRSLRTVTRRVADWWSADTISAQFSRERERDQRLLRRVR